MTVNFSDIYFEDFREKAESRGILCGFLVLSLAAHSLLFSSYESREILIPSVDSKTLSIATRLVDEKRSQPDTLNKPKSIIAEKTEKKAPMSRHNELSKKLIETTPVLKDIVNEIRPATHAAKLIQTDADTNKITDHKEKIARLRRSPNTEPNSDIGKIVNSIKKSATRENIITSISSKFARYFRYPYLARRRGWEGRVVLGFDLDTNGLIENIRIVKSSGYGTLDRSAVKSLHEVGDKERFDGVPEGSDWDMSLPVIYRLLDS